MPKNSTAKKSTAKKSTTRRPSAKWSPRTSKDAARTQLSAKSDRLADGKQDHEVPTAREDANATHAATPAPKTRVKRGNAEKAPRETKAPKGKAAKVTPKREAKVKRPSGLDLAAKVLSSAREPLNAKAIAERVLAAGWSTSGKTPHATLYAAMIREIAARGRDARFRKTERGLFAVANGKGA